MKSLNLGYVCHVVPSIWVFFLISDIPQNGSVSESLTHTSGHRLVKSTPGQAWPYVCVEKGKEIDPFSATSE